MLQRLGIREKLLAVVAVPILVLVLAAGFIGITSLQDLSSARNSQELIDTLDRARSLRAGLQDERAVTTNFAHVVADTRNKLSESYDFTDTALSNVEARLDRVANEDPEVDTAGIMRQVNEAISRDGGSYMATERAVEIRPPSEESGGWAEFPLEDEIAQMQAGYADARTKIDALAESLPDDLALSGPLTALGFRLNVESELATSLFTEPLGYVEAMDSAAARVDTALAALEGSADALAGSEENQRAVQALRDGSGALAALPQSRASARALEIGPVALTISYTSVIDIIVSAADDVAVAMADRELVSTVQAYADLETLIENVKYEEVVFERLIRAASFLPGEDAQVRTAVTQTDLALEDAQDSSRGLGWAPEVPDFGASVSEVAGATASYISVRTQLLTGLDSVLFAARNAQWTDQVAQELDVYEPLREQMWDRVESRAADNAQSALLSTIVTLVAIAAVVALSITIALVIARRIIGPLQRLTTTATAVRQELPRMVERVAMPGETVDVSEVQIPVESEDEVGRLAEAFNGVNAATLAIAGEQAALRGSISEMFVNVARRDQVLLNRQLASIDEMERSEDNPETLTKLFALDHLATRMRRNSESLLVLAGLDTGRRLRRPMPLSDVVRTASSEIELYERVHLELDVDPEMLGHSALTTAHLIAELLENATVFSEPGSFVVVRTARRGDDYVVEIEDSGIGMTAKELDDANGRVASTAASEILGAQRLGLFVVGRIARRIGAHVELESEEGHGTRATVTMPRALFAVDPEPAAPHTPPSTVDAETQAPAALLPGGIREEFSEPEPADPGIYAPLAVETGRSLSERSEGSAPQPTSPAPVLPDPVSEQPAPAKRVPLDTRAVAFFSRKPRASKPPAEVPAPAEDDAPSPLPARQRREAPAPADEDRERQSIFGLPARATEAQLSALDAEQAGGFTPAISPTELAPQSPEQRASMFRGFRSRRETERAVADAPQETPQTSAAAQQWQAVPALEPDEDAQTEIQAPAASEPEHPSDLPAFSMPKLDVGEPSAAQTPVEVPSFEPEDEDGDYGSFTRRAHTNAADASAFVVPALEDEDENEQDPAPVADELPWAPLQVAHEEPVALDQPLDALAHEVADTPAVAPPPTEESSPLPERGSAAPWFTPPAERTPDAVEPEPARGFWAAPVSAPSAASAAPDVDAATPSVEPAPTPPLPAPPHSPPATPVAGVVPAQPPIEQPPVQSHEPSEHSPSLDDLIQSAADDDTEQRPGFFSRLFGRGRAAEASAEPQPESAPATAATAAEARPWTAINAPQSQQSAVEPTAQSAARPHASEPEPASPAPWAQQPVTEKAHAEVPEALTEERETKPASAAPSGVFMPDADPSWVPNKWPSAPKPVDSPPPAELAGEEPADQPPQVFRPDPEPKPQLNAWGVPTSSMPDWATSASGFTPDELANPHGWETAGASALEAAEPEGGTTYRPVLQPESGPDGADLASAVFSELSSLASERPKVEKTRAGLQRRRPADAEPVKVTPIEPETSQAPPERDAEAVRHRFNAFYSGTQRARDDVATFERQTAPAEASDS